MFLDHHSRMPLGYYLSYGGASAAAVMGAQRHAVPPKTPAARVMPKLHVEHVWPCYGLPDTLVLDNGLEFLGDTLESVALDLGIRLQFCPKHQPRFKGSIERFLKKLQASLRLSAVRHEPRKTSSARRLRPGQARCHDLEPVRAGLRKMDARRVCAASPSRPRRGEPLEETKRGRAPTRTYIAGQPRNAAPTHWTGQREGASARRDHAHRCMLSEINGI